MGGGGKMLEDLFINILEISLTSAAAIAVILIISNLAESKFRKKWRYWVWVLLAIYLIVPIRIDLPDAPIKMEIPQKEMVLTRTEERISGGYMTETENGLSTGTSAIIGDEHAAEDPAPAGEEDLSTEKNVFIFPIVFVGAVLWLCGAVIVCGWNVAMYFRFVARSRPWNREIKNEEVLLTFERIKKEMGISKRVGIFENRLIKSPMMLGFIKPRVVLPAEALLDGEYEFVLRHELTHYKRGDIWFKFLLMLAASLHWFNPMVGTMCSYAENDIEITCDEAVVKAMDSEYRKEYCAAILNIMRRGQNSPLMLSTSFYGGAKVLKKRFSAVLEPRKHRGIGLFVVAAMVIAISATLVACGAEEILPEELAANDLVFSVMDKEEEPEAEVKTAEEIIIEAKALAGTAFAGMNLGEKCTFFGMTSEDVEKYINEISEGKQRYLAENSVDRLDGSYSVSFELLAAVEFGGGMEIVLTATEEYEWDDPATLAGYVPYEEKHHVKLTYTYGEEIFTGFVVYGIDWMDESYYIELSSSDDPRPDVEGPDENGKFPIITDAEWDRWVTYNGAADTEKPEEEISSVLDCADVVESLARNYPEIDDWNIVYETGYYELVYCYDPYTYSFRYVYMPKRFALLETEQGEGFDRLFINTYESYLAAHVTGGIEPRVERYLRFTEAYESEIEVGKLGGASIIENGSSFCKALWFPTENKMIYFGDDSGVYAIYGVNEPLNIVGDKNIFRGYDVSENKLEAPEGRENDMILYIDLEEGNSREKVTAAYYDAETKSLDIYENSTAGEDEVFPQIYFLDSDTMIIEAAGTLYFYNTYPWAQMTESFAKIGGNGKGLSDGEIKDCGFLQIDKNKGGRYLWIYSDEEKGEFAMCTFDAKGNILSNFGLGLSSKGVIGSANYRSGIVYFSYYPDSYSAGGTEQARKYAVDSRPDKNHNLQANAW